MATKLTLFLDAFSLRSFLFLYRRHFLNILQRQYQYLSTKIWGFTPFLTVSLWKSQQAQNKQRWLRKTRLVHSRLTRSRIQFSLPIPFMLLYILFGTLHNPYITHTPILFVEHCAEHCGSIKLPEMKIWKNWNRGFTKWFWTSQVSRSIHIISMLVRLFSWLLQ